ncbi:hypothetical protein A5N75_08310 [Prescottella equi]|nr:hypothetical protein A5N75_08310 [Prescottella equi]
MEVVLRGIAETMLPDGTRRLTIYDYQDPAVGDLSEAAERRFQRTAQLIGLEVRHVRCVETLYRSGRVIGATFEAEVWRPL